MATPSARLALLEPVGADTVAELRLAITNHATTLDGSILYSSGTLAARPASPTVAPQVYKATDTGLTYWWNGTAWVTLQFSPNVRTSAGGASTITAANGDCILLLGGDTCQMPSSAVTGAVVSVASASASGTSPAIVSGSVSGTEFYGRGLHGASSFPLGDVNSAGVMLIYAGSGIWWFVAGQQDTGWVALSLQPNYTPISSPLGSPPMVRLVGDRGWLQGAVNTSAGAGAIPFYVPTFAHPSVDRGFAAYSNWLTNGIVGGYVATDGSVNMKTTATGQGIYFDDVSWSL